MKEIEGASRAGYSMINETCQLAIDKSSPKNKSKVVMSRNYLGAE